MVMRGWDMPRPHTMPPGEALQHARQESWTVQCFQHVWKGLPAAAAAAAAGDLFSTACGML